MNGQGQPPICDHIIRAHKLCMELNDIMVFINSSHNIDEILQKVVEGSCKALGCESARIAMREGDNWVIRFVSNLPNDLIGRSFTDEELPHAALAMTTRKIIAIDDAFHDDRTNNEMMKSLGIKSVMVIPLLDRNVVIGTLLYGYHSSVVSFTVPQMDYAGRMATGVALALQDARLYQDLEESKKLSDALNEIDTVLFSMKDYGVIMNRMLQLATDVIGAESAVVFSKEGNRWIVHYEYKLPASLIGQSFSNTEVMHTAITEKTKRSLVVQDVLNNPDIDQKFVEMLGIRSLLDFPLIVKGEVIGDLTFHYHSGDVPFNERQVEFVRKLQISMSLALENGRLLNISKQSESKLKEANIELEAFNYTVAHDLRGPLNSMGLYFQTIQMQYGAKLDETCREYLTGGYKNVQRMSQLIDVLLEFSKLSNVEPRREDFDISAVAREILDELKRTSPERRYLFRIADGIMVNGDPKLLGVALNNLLRNAWKYTGKKEETVIEFGATEIAGNQAYFVRDNGEGFDLADADKLFIPFQRLPGSEEFKGSGIGLATVERIIRRHGGKVWAEGEPGKGACFYFTLSD